MLWWLVFFFFWISALPVERGAFGAVRAAKGSHAHLALVLPGKEGKLPVAYVANVFGLAGG